MHLKNIKSLSVLILIIKYETISQPTTKLQKEEKSGIYKMTCECGSIYIGQMARNFYKRHKEHLPPKNLKKNIIIKSNFAKHILNSKHEYQTK